MHVPDVAAAVRFFRDLLGFRVEIESGDYAYVHRETAGMRIMRASNSPGEEVPPGNCRFLYYIDVRDVAAIEEEVRPRLAGFPYVRVHGPVDQPYGQREWMLVAPDGNLIVFGQAIASAPVQA